jgi:uncharacterized protein YqeY
MPEQPGLKQRVSDDMKAAMRSGDTLRRDTLRMLGATIKNAEIEKRHTALEEVEIVALVAREIKRRQESIDAFQAGHRPDLVAKEAAEKKILEGYMPAQMDRAEIEGLVNKVIAAVGASGPADKGKVMKDLMPQVKGKADGKLVNDIVTELLNR